MQSTPRRDPKSFAQRTMAAAIAASAIAAFGIAQAQTTGGGIGANVNSSPGPSGNLPTQGTTGTAGGTTTSGVAAPNAPANPARPGTGPGINNTGSPVLATPPSLRTQIGGSPGRTPRGTAKIPGNTIPAPPSRSTRGLNGANVPQPTTAPDRIPTAERRALTPTTVPNTSAVNRQPGANLRTGVITDYTDTSISFQEGANTNKFVITPETVVQMDGRNIGLDDIPANAQVRIERNPRSANTVQRIVVTSPTASSTGGTSVNMQTGTGSTGSANRSLQDRAEIGGFGGATNRTGTPPSGPSTPGGDLNAATPNASVPGGDINAPTANASTPGGDINAPVVNEPNVSNRPLAPGQNPADQPVAPFTRGSEQRLQAGFDEPASRNQQNQTQPQQPTADSSQFLGPSSARVPAKPDSGDATWTGTIGSRLGIQMNDSQQGLTVGNVTAQSLAARSGLMAGDRIQSVNGTNVATAADFGRALRMASRDQGPVTASVLRNGTPQNVAFSLPGGFFNGIQIPAANNAAAAATIGTAPALSTGAGNIVVSPDGTPGVNVGGVIVPATEGTQVGAAGAAATTTATPGGQAVTQEQTVVQGQAPVRARPDDPPVGTQRVGVTTEALKVPDIDLGWTLKATPEGVVLSSIVDNGLAAKNRLEPGDVIESIDGRPITAPGAVSYELHRHRAGAAVKFGVLRNGRRFTEDVILPEDHKPLLLNRNETFGQANNNAKEQGGSGANPLPVRPTEESIRRLEAENKALRDELEELRRKK